MAPAAVKPSRSYHDLIDWTFAEVVTTAFTSMCLCTAGTWPSQLGIVNTGVPEQYCWSIFVMVSAAVQLTWGSYNPITWGEALVWTFAMITVAVLFVIMVGFIIAAIKSSSLGHTKYKDSMDAIMVSAPISVKICCTA